MEVHDLEKHLAHAEPTPGFSRAVISQVQKIVTNTVDMSTIQRRQVPGISIDGPTTTDADDAVWCERIGSGYRVYVTITDISDAIPLYSPLDMEAMVRSTSVYFHPHVIPMLPDALSSDLYSLNGKRKHKGITVQFDVDEEGNIPHREVYESLLDNKKCYHHEDFMAESRNPDSQHAELIRDLFSVTDLLSKNRGINIGAQGLSELGERSGESQGHESGGGNVHTMIATLMVMANQLIAQRLILSSEFGIFRQHLHLRERAFYTLQSGKHEGLGIYPPNGYTHFTSPLRRYPDMLVHRMLKAGMRKEKPPYSDEHLRAILGYINRRILEVEIILGEHKGQKIVERLQKRTGRTPRTHDLKSQIKKGARDAYYVIPQAIRKSIIADISDPDSRTWQWAVGIILLCNDYELKHILFQKIFSERKMTGRAFLNTLSQTRIILGEDTIFQLEEITDANLFKMNMTLPDGKILSSQTLIKKRGNLKDNKGRARKRLMLKVFRYYMDQ